MDQAVKEGRELGVHELIPKWAPNAIRHTAGTSVREQFGLDGSQNILGHKRASTSEIYSVLSFDKAAEIARKIG